MLSYIDLDLQAGQLIAITGPGVSVKTLLLKGLLGEVAQYSHASKVCSTFPTTTKKRVASATPFPTPTIFNRPQLNQMAAPIRAFGAVISGNRPKNAELTPTQRAFICGAWEAGKKQTELAEQFGCSTRTISNTIKRFQNHGTFDSLPRSGSPGKLSDAAKR